MFYREKASSAWNAFRRDQRGNMALTFAISATVCVGVMGSAMDFATLSSAHKRSQSIADSAALSAAIFVKNNDRLPKSEEEGYMDERVYTAAELGIEYKGWVDGGSEGVNIVVDYDDNAKEATVTVTGNTTTTFLQVLGHHDMAFKAESVVSYMNVDEKFPASITLVLDNSGSMRWDDTKMTDAGQRPASPKARMDGLKSSIANFRTDLQSRLGNQTKSSGHRVLRTGILPYNSEIKEWTNDASDGMLWGFSGVSNNHVNNMTPEGGTNSNPPMEQAKNWLDEEEVQHRREATRTDEEYREPLKFVVFMTDGQNSTGTLEFVPDQTSSRFYAYKSLFGKPAQWWYSQGKYDSDFERGRLELDSDRRTIESCQAMHAEGVEIYTIGFALEVGMYYDPLYPNTPQPVTEVMQATAFGLLSACASKPENFIEASDGDELEGAFDSIQNAIIEELIRVKS